MSRELRAPMFTLLAPQRAANPEGFIIKVVSRESVEYIEGAERYAITVDFGRSVGVHMHTLKPVSGIPLSQEESNIIIGRISMGCTQWIVKRSFSEE